MAVVGSFISPRAGPESIP